MIKHVEKKAVREILADMENSLIPHHVGFEKLHVLVDEKKSINPIALFYDLQIGLLETDFMKYIEGLEGVHESKFSDEALVELMQLTNAGIRDMSGKCKEVLKAQG